MPLTFVSLTRQIYALRKRGPRKAARFWGLLYALTLAAWLSVGIFRELTEIKRKKMVLKIKEKQ